MRNLKFFCGYIIVAATLFALANFSYGYDFTGAKWYLGDMPVSYSINNAGSSDTDVFGSVQSSFSAWSGISGSFLTYSYDGTSGSTSAPSNDGINLIIWRESGWSYGPSVIAVCSVTYGGDHIVDSDIQFNGVNYVWSNSGEAGKMDVQNIATHEIGHFGGLDDLYDAADSEKTMYGYAEEGETKKRSLHSDDINGIVALYPSGIVDTTDPNTSITSGPAGTITATNNATFQYTGSDDVTATGNLVYSYWLQGRDASYSGYTSATSKTYTALANGSYTFYVKAKDQAGNVDATPASRAFTIDYTPADATAPNTSITSGPSGTVSSGDATFEFTGTDNISLAANLTYSCKLNGYDADYSSFSADTSKSYAGLPYGTYTFYVKAKDEAGNVDASPASRSFTVAPPSDAIPPDTSITSGPSGTINVASASFGFTGSDETSLAGDLTYSYFLDGYDTDYSLYSSDTTADYFGLADGTYTFYVKAKDEAGNVDASPDSREFTVFYDSPTNNRPIANAGADETVEPGEYQFDGSASSDPDGNSITYKWTPPAGITMTGANTATPTCNFTTARFCTFKLVVNDGQVDSETDYVTITVNNVPPIANAGADQTVMIDMLTTLNGGGSHDPNGSSVTYNWSAPVGVALSNNTAVMPSFTPTDAGIYTFTLVVNDGANDSEPDEVNVTVNSDNSVPVAHAGADQIVEKGTTATLDGSASSDADGDTLTYIWRQISGETATLSDSATANPTFAVSGNETLTFGLTVNDGEFNSLEDTVDVCVTDDLLGDSVVTSEGGTVTFTTPQGVAEIQFGGNAVSSPLHIGFGIYDNPPELPENYSRFGDAFELEPIGAQLNNNITVRIPYTDSMLGGRDFSRIKLFELDAATGTYTLLTINYIDIENNLVHFSANHFSVYRLAYEYVEEPYPPAGPGVSTDPKCFVAQASYSENATGNGSFIEKLVAAFRKWLP